MNKFFSFLLISLLLLVGLVGSICVCFSSNNIGSIIIMIILSLILFVGFIYCCMVAFSFKFGKKLRAIITNKEYIPTDNDEHSDNAYYKYTYQVNVNDKIKKGSFKVYCLDVDVVNNLNVGNEIEVNQFLFAISVDVNKFLRRVRGSYREGDKNKELLKSQKKNVSRALKIDLIIGVAIFVLIAICFFIYFGGIIK